MPDFKASARRLLIRIGAITSGDVIPSLEAVYQNIVHRDLAALSIPDNFYAVSSAANYSLFYILLRSAQELQINSLVELGAGQTSLLIERLRQKGLLKGAAMTIEHDGKWANRVSTIVTHPVVTVPLKQNSAPRRFRGYDFSSTTIPSKLDYLIIDGPEAFDRSRRFARLGALPLLRHLDREGFVIIVDDAEREGERLLVKHIDLALTNEGHSYLKGEIRGAKKQVIFASGLMRQAAYF